jgi:tetratricopeptide (TPR) repeat protein
VGVVGGPRGAHDGARGQLKEAAATLSERGASVERDGEHGIRAVFGDHRLRGDEAVRAVRAAASVRGRGLRVVVVTGLTRRLGDALDGPVLSRAASLLAGTAEGELLVDAATAVALGGRFETEGRREGLHIGRDLERLHSVPPRSQLYDEGTLPGREEPIALTLSRVREAWKQRRPVVLVVQGEPGIGKSTLARELIARLLAERALDVESSAAPLLTLRGDLLASHTPLGAIGRALRERAGIQEGATPEAQRARLEHLVDGALDETSLGFLADIARVPLRAEGSVLRAARRDPDLFRDGLLRSLLGLIRATNASSPALLLLEDAQWIDGSTLEAVASIVDALPTAALVVLALTRPEPEALARLGRVWSALPRTDLVLPPLAPAVVQGLAARGLGPIDDPRLRADLAARCGGNPLFLEELLGVVREAAERHPDQGPRVELPTAALSAVQLRLDGLDPEARRIARAASVFGSVFWRDGLASVVGASPEAQLDRPLRVLSSQGFVAPRPSSRVAGTIEYAFRHDLVRDAAYATLLDDDRRALHARVATWLSARERTDPALIARHHDLATQPELARPGWLRAARDALRDQAFHAALENATRALAGSPPPNERRETLCVRADASFALADSATALDDARAAESIPGASAAQRLRVALCVANGQTLQGRLDAGLAVLQVACARAASVARGPGSDEVPPALWLSATLRQAHLMTQRGIARDALELANAAMSDPRTPQADRDAARSLADAVVGGALLGLQRLEEARDACEQALDRSQRDCDLPRMFQAAIAKGRVLTRLGEHARAVQRLERARDDARRLGMALYETVALQQLGVALARRGDGAEALRVEAQAHSLASQHGLARIAARSRVYTAWIEGFDPRVPAAEASLRWLAMSSDEGRGDAPLRCLLRAAHARLLLLHRDGEGALAPAKEAVTLLDAGVTLEDGDVFARWVYADVLAKLGRRGEADDAYVRAWSRVNALLANIGDDDRRRRCREGSLEHRALADTIVARGLPTINVLG